MHSKYRTSAAAPRSGPVGVVNKMSSIENMVAQRPAQSPQQTLPTLHVEDRHGVVHELEAVEGWRLMEILRDHGVGMDNTCGGALACAE